MPVRNVLVGWSTPSTRISIRLTPLPLCDRTSSAQPAATATPATLGQGIGSPPHDPVARGASM
jgi:hypothetical protein